MANTTIGDVWFIDTKGTLVAAGSNVTINSFLWTCVTVAPTTRVQVTDGSGRAIFTTGCEKFVAYTQPVNLDGVIVSAITGGTLYIQVS